MQDKYKYLKDTSKLPLELQLIEGKSAQFIKIKAHYFALYQDLRFIEDNYNLLHKWGLMLNPPHRNDLSDIEIKVMLKSCAYSIVQAVCRILEKPNQRNMQQTNCLYTRIQQDIRCEKTKQKCLTLHKELVNESWYKTLKTFRDKRISHQEGYWDTYSAELIGELLSNDPQKLIVKIKTLLEFCASTGLNGGVLKYISRNQ